MGHIKPYCEWPDLLQAPGNDVVRLQAVSVKSESGTVTDAFDIRTSVTVQIEFDVLKSNAVLVAGFGLYNEENVTIFIAYDRDPAWYRRPRPLGRYVSTARIPG